MQVCFCIFFCNPGEDVLKSQFRSPIFANAEFDSIGRFLSDFMEILRILKENFKKFIVLLLTFLRKALN